jgi:phospholipid N-methyltransferase
MARSGHVPLLKSMVESARFLREFARAPGVTGAVAPSSPYLAEKIVEWIDWETTSTLVEWGPGTGSFTKAILERKPARCRYLAMEVSQDMCDVLRERFPGIEVFRRSVTDVAEVCEHECIEAVDCVVCGLPWAAFSDAMQTEFLDALTCVLRPGGQFTTFAYVHGLAVPAAHRFRRKLDACFSEVATTDTVWLNVPPAFVYRCRR